MIVTSTGPSVPLPVVMPGPALRAANANPAPTPETPRVEKTRPIVATVGEADWMHALGDLRRIRSRNLQVQAQVSPVERARYAALASLAEIRRTATALPSARFDLFT